MKVKPGPTENPGPKPQTALRKEDEGPKSIGLEAVGMRGEETWKAAGRALSAESRVK